MLFEKWYEENHEEVKRWASLEGSEVGEVMNHIIDIIDMSDYVAYDFYIKCIVELKDIYEWLQKQYAIVEVDAPPTSRKYYTLEEI